MLYEFQLSSRESQWDVDVDWVWGLENVDVVLVHWSLEGERGTARVNHCRRDSYGDG